MCGEKRRELGRAGRLLGGTPREAAPRGAPRTARTSDPLVVLGGRESRPQGEAVDRGSQPAQETGAGHDGPETRLPTSLRGIANKAQRRLLRLDAEARTPEEPGAGNPHAGICAGAVG